MLPGVKPTDASTPAEAALRLRDVLPGVKPTIDDRIAQAMWNKACADDLDRSVGEYAAEPWTDADQFLFLKRLERTCQGLAQLALADAVSRAGV